MAVTFEQLRDGLAHTRDLWRAMTGEDKYKKYLARHAREHGDCPEHPPMTARQFWRHLADEAERNVQARCC